MRFLKPENSRGLNQKLGDINAARRLLLVLHSLSCICAHLFHQSADNLQGYYSLLCE